MYSQIRLIGLVILFMICSKANSQTSYYQDQFLGGVTGAGYSPSYSQTAPTTGVITVNIAPGSTIRRAYLIAGRLGNAPATNVTLNGTPLTFNATNQVTGPFNTIYGGASGVHVINVTTIVNPAVNVYNLALPTQASTSNRYQDFYLYISYDNPTLSSVATAIFLNNQNAANIMNWGTLNFTYPFNTLAGDIGYSFFGGYECSAGDGEKLFINGTNLGTVWGQDINSGMCGGPVGSFYYRNNTLTALSDDNVNQAVNGPEALSNIVALVTNNSNTLTVSHQHASTTASDNHPWGAIFAYGSCQNPTVTAVASPTSVCPGNPVTLTASGAATYTWLPGNITTTVASVNPLTTTIYTVNAKNTSGCQGTQTVMVTVNPLPTVNVAATPSAICIGNSTSLSASGASTYTWSPGALNGGTVTVSPAASAIYTVTGTSTAGCVGSNTLAVTVNPLPVVAPANNGPVCVGGVLNLSVAASTSYTWSGPNSFSSNLQNPSISNVASLEGGVYTVSVTNANGCVNSNTTNVVISPLPVITPTNNGPYCEGATIQLSVGAASTYTWSGPSVFNSNLQNPTIPASQLINGGVYSVTVANAGGCIASGTTAVTVNALPSPTATSNSPICETNALNFNGSGGTTYTWTIPGGFSSNQQNPGITIASVANSGMGSLTVADANGCVNTVTFNVVVNANPVITVSNPTACAGQNINLTASGGSSYNWSGPLGYSSSVQNPVIAGATSAMGGAYSVTVTSAAGCSNTAVSNAQVFDLPVPQASSNGPICEGTQLSLNASGGQTYLWTGPNGFNSSLQNPSFTANTSNYSGNYNLTVIDVNGCSSTTVIAVTINPMPNASINSNVKGGCAPLCVTFNANSAATIATYNWNLGNGVTSSDAQPQTCFGTTGVYSVNVTVADAIGCSNSATYTIEVYPQPTADFNHAPIKPIINIDPDVTFTDASHGAPIVAWNWYFMNTAQYTSNQQNPVFVYTEPGLYAVALVVKSDKGCLDTLVRTVEVGEDFGLYVPNAFTPNDDGMNDVFQPKGFGIVDYQLQIFDRWGEKIFETNDFNEGWNGTRKSKNDVKYGIIMDGTYTWLINVKDVFGKAHELKGHVTLIK